MSPEDFLKTIYLGDRACKSLLIDGWSAKVAIQVNLISRIRSESGKRDFYSSEDLIDGLIVFTEANFLQLEPPGFVPNDLINNLEILPEPLIGEDSKTRFMFQISIDSVNWKGERQEVIIKIIAQGIHLESSSNPGIKITE